MASSFLHYALDGFPHGRAADAELFGKRGYAEMGARCEFVANDGAAQHAVYRVGDTLSLEIRYLGNDWHDGLPIWVGTLAAQKFSM